MANPALVEHLNKAISAHSRWKLRLVDAIDNGSSEFTPGTVALDNQCEFGKFLYGDFSGSDQRDAHYARVKDLHAQFHVQASRVLALAVGGHKDDARNAMAANSDFAKVSTALVLQLADWKAAA